MRIVPVTAATFRPLEVEAIKNRPELRVTAGDDDPSIVDMIQSAVEAYQEFTENILCLSTWDLYLDAIAFNRIETPAPLVSASITYLDSAGASQTLATTVYKVDTTSPLAGRITLKSGRVWPTTLLEANAVVVRFSAGWATAAAIPQRIKDGLILKIQELYDGIDRSMAYEACWRAYRRIVC